MRTGLSMLIQNGGESANSTAGTAINAVGYIDHMDDLPLPTDSLGGAYFETGGAALAISCDGMAHRETSRPSCGWISICWALYLLRIIAGNSSSMARGPNPNALTVSGVGMPNW